LTGESSVRTPGGPPRQAELAIGGMTCASCAARVEKKLNKLDGVTATVNFATETARVSFPAAVSAGDLISEIAAVADRFYRSPELVGTYSVLLAENVDPDAPLHDRLAARYRGAIDIIAALIRRGQDAGQFRMDMDVTVKAVQILAFITGMETTWLINPSIPLSEVFKEYSESLARDMAPPSRA